MPSLGIIPNGVVGPEPDPRGDWPAGKVRVEGSESYFFILQIQSKFIDAFLCVNYTW